MLKTLEVCRYVDKTGQCGVCAGIKCPYHIDEWFGYWISAMENCLIYEASI